MDIFLISFAVLLIIIGIIGSILPIIPGPPIVFIGMLLTHFTSERPFSFEMLILFGTLAAASAVIDNVLPIYATKIFNGSKKGVWCSAIGLLVGLFFTPIGLLIGPILGAFLGEIFDGKSANNALKPAFGSFLGFLSSIFLRFSLSIIMAYFFFMEVIL